MKRFSLMFLIFISLINILGSKELAATVTVNYEQLETSGKERLVDFSRRVEDYLNNTSFTDLVWEGEPIKCSFTIFFMGASDDLTYTAQVVVTSQRPIYRSQNSSLMLRIQDQKWQFKYEQGQALYFNQTDFDPLTSFLDFYAYLIIAYDMDSFEPLGGTQYFQKAFEISVLGGSSRFSDGWSLSSESYNKRGFIENITNANFQQFRQDFFEYHFNGLDLYSTNKAEAQNKMVQLINNLFEKRDKIERRSVLLKIFFDAKSGEIVDYLKDFPNKEIFDKLKRIDPAHISKYDEALNN